MVDKIAFVFPGQGSQYVGMGKSCIEKSRNAQALFEKADQILSYPLSRLLLEGPEEKLKETVVTQPALFLASAAALELLKERGLSARWFAGHSLGEYSALYAAGALSFEDGLRLVEARGKAMHEAARENPGAMAAILGLDENKITEICARVSQETGVCTPANFNSDGQIVISGKEQAVLKAMELTTQAGAVKVVRLNVSGAFHSPLMSSAVSKLKPAMEKCSFSDISFPVVTNVDAEPTTRADDFKRKLLEQIDHPVRWNQTMKNILTWGAETVIEVGSGKVLATLFKKADRKKNVFWTDDLEALDKFFTAKPVQEFN